MLRSKRSSLSDPHVGIPCSRKCSFLPSSIWGQEFYRLVRLVSIDIKMRTSNWLLRFFGYRDGTITTFDSNDCKNHPLCLPYDRSSQSQIWLTIWGSGKREGDKGISIYLLDWITSGSNVVLIGLTETQLRPCLVGMDSRRCWRALPPMDTRLMIVKKYFAEVGREMVSPNSISSTFCLQISGWILDFENSLPGAKCMIFLLSSSLGWSFGNFIPNSRGWHNFLG